MLLKLDMEKLATATLKSMEEHFPSKEYVIYADREGHKDWYNKNFVTCVPIHRITVFYSRGEIFTVKISSKNNLDEEVLIFGCIHLLWDNYELVLFVLDGDMQKFVEIYELSSKILDLTNFINRKNILLLDFSFKNRTGQTIVA